MTNPLIPMMNESEFRAVAKLVKRYNPCVKANGWTLDDQRNTVLSLMKIIHDEGGSPSQTSTGGFVVTLGYVRDGRAYYHISLDAELLCPDKKYEFIGDAEVDLSNVSS